MALYLYNTLSRARERFVPADPGRVTMYVCGPTVYNFSHIGNARPYVVFDVLARLLRRSYRLVYARNFTDVDDKINAAARELGMSIGEVTAAYIDQFHEDMDELGVLRPDIEPRATAHIDEIIAFVQCLLETGHAYEAERHVLFSVASFQGYGKLSRRSRDDMVAGARVEVAPFKRDPADFVLWKPSDAATVGWDSPWGRGRPGWHIECSAMARAHLGQTIDIHCGGQDLVFPHHENEIAQSTCAHGGAPFCRYWLHNGLLRIDGAKMAKSAGNILSIWEALQGYSGEVVRLMLLTAHYRQPLDFSGNMGMAARRQLDRIYAALDDAGIEGEGNADDVPPPEPLIDALENDLNTPQALAALSDLARKTNRCRDPGARRDSALALRAGGRLLGLLQQDPGEWARTAWGGGGRITNAAIDALLSRHEVRRKHGNDDEARKAVELMADNGIDIEEVRWRLHRPVMRIRHIRRQSLHQSAPSEDGELAAHESAGEADSVQLTEAEVAALVEQRKLLRTERKFAEADAIRDALAAKGIVLEDRGDGTTWRREAQ